MVFGHNLNAKEKALLDFYYGNNFEERITNLEAGIPLLEERITNLETSVLMLNNRRSKTFRFTGMTSSEIVLPYPIINEVEPVVAINGLIQAIGADYEIPANTLIEFSENLLADDIVTVYLTYMETT